MINVESLTRTFSVPGGEEILAVNNLSFQVDPGEVYCLLGPNGAGKTTTLRMLLGLLKPTSGKASIAGFHSDEQPDEVKRRVGFVSTSAGLYPMLSVREMLEFFSDLYGADPNESREELNRLARVLDLKKILKRRCTTLSTGQKQRVNLARALIHRPPVLLMDEPTGGLDVLGTQMIVELIAQLKTEGKAIILTTHRLNEAERLGDRFGLLHEGSLVSEGTLEQLRSETGCESLVEMFLNRAQVGPMLNLLEESERAES